MAANGRRDEAEASFREALRIQGPLNKQSPTVAGLRWRLARTYCNLGSLLMSAGQAAEAEELETKARDLQKTLVDEFPRVPDYAQELAATDDNLGLLWTPLAPRKAEEAYQQALALLEGLARRYPNRPDYRQRLAVTHLNLGTLLARTDPPEAERACRKALEIQDKLVAEFPAIPEYEDGLARTLFSLAYLRNTRRDLDGARRLLLEAITHQRHVREANPSNDLFRAHLGESLGLLATTSIQLGDHAGAARAAEELPRVLPDDLREYVRAVIFLTRCMTLAASDPPLEESYRGKPSTCSARWSAGSCSGTSGTWTGGTSTRFATATTSRSSAGGWRTAAGSARVERLRPPAPPQSPGTRDPGKSGWARRLILAFLTFADLRLDSIRVILSTRIVANRHPRMINHEPLPCVAPVPRTGASPFSDTPGRGDRAPGLAGDLLRAQHQRLRRQLAPPGDPRRQQHGGAGR